MPKDKKGELKKYEPMMQAILKDGRILYYPESKNNVVVEALKKDPFVRIEGVMVNKFEIKYIEPVGEDYDLLGNLNEDQRTLALAAFQVSREALGKEPSRSVKLAKIAKIIDGEKII